MNSDTCATWAGAKPGSVDQWAYDVVVVGGGVAGMTVALSLDSKLKIALIVKNNGTQSSTYKAQGGIAAAVGPDDNPSLHLADTLRVGQGLCRPEAVEVLTQEGPAAIEFLQSHGTEFNSLESGLDLTREAGHSRNRVVHYYDYSGRQVSETLARLLPERTNIDKIDDCFLVDILISNGECYGCVFLHAGKPVMVRAKAVVLATGGYAGLFARSSNSSTTVGDGIAAAYRAGAVIADMEFVQFHPTTFTTLAGEVFLLTEALRGEGAFLLNSAGERFMTGYHPDGELAPRDEVSRAIIQEMKSGNGTVYLDARHIGKESLSQRFRQVYAKLAEDNYYLERDLIPVAPAAHYSIGGILTDIWGKTTVPYLYACGESAATGVHGANRLASNSLLEGVVFGRRVAKVINDDFPARGDCLELPAAICSKGNSSKGIAIFGEILDDFAGAIRNGEEISWLLYYMKQAPLAGEINNDKVQECQAYNIAQMTELILEAALARNESRGTHFRIDFPEKNDADFKKHTIQQKGKKVSLR